MLSNKEVNILLEDDNDKEGFRFSQFKIMIVEDDKNTQLLYDRGLFDEIFDKKFVSTGTDAIRVHEEWRPDIIMLDVYLPEMTGYSVLKQIREKIGDKDTVIIMATVLRDKEDVTSCMKYSIEGYIAKPFNFKEIGGTILKYYAKKNPNKAREAEIIHNEVKKRTYVNMLLEEQNQEQDETKRKEVKAAEKPGREEQKLKDQTEKKEE